MHAEQNLQREFYYCRNLPMHKTYAMLAFFMCQSYEGKTTRGGLRQAVKEHFNDFDCLFKFFGISGEGDDAAVGNVSGIGEHGHIIGFDAIIDFISPFFSRSETVSSGRYSRTSRKAFILP